MDDRLHERIRSRVKLAGDGSGCWLWSGGTNPKGYGRARDPRGDVSRKVLVHRYVYEVIVGPIPHGLQIDHLCKRPGCVNFLHLEPVTPAENSRRGRVGEFNRSKTHCPAGHPLSGPNLYKSRGSRYCRACRKEQNRMAYLKRLGLLEG